jgi:hypothetical protein
MHRGHAGGKLLTALGLIVASVPLGPGAGVANSTGARGLDLHPRGLAHQMPPVEVPAAAASVGLLLAGLLALLVGGALWRLVSRRTRMRVAMATLALALALFTFETALHSVHHLTHPGSGAECSVLFGSQHLAWGATELLATEAPARQSTVPPHVTSEDAVRAPIHRPHQGRAPPA